MAGNDGTLNQRETGVGIFDQLTFQNDSPAGAAGRNLREGDEEYDNWQGHKVAYDHDEVEPAPWETDNDSASKAESPEADQNKMNIEFSGVGEADQAEGNSEIIEAEYEEVEPEAEESEYSAMFADEGSEQPNDEIEQEEEDYSFLADDETEAKFEEQDKQDEAVAEMEAPAEEEGMEMER